MPIGDFEREVLRLIAAQCALVASVPHRGPGAELGSLVQSHTHCMNEEHADGARWQEMCSLMLELYQHLGAALEQKPWHFSRRPDSTWQQAEEEWLALEAIYIESIYALARELSRTDSLTKPEPPALYFLHLRFSVAMRFVGHALFWKDDKPWSMIPFPKVQPREFAEWLLTEWADDKAVDEVIHEEP